jgi:hypothetical protein
MSGLFNGFAALARSAQLPSATTVIVYNLVRHLHDIR